MHSRSCEKRENGKIQTESQLRRTGKWANLNGFVDAKNGKMGKLNEVAAAKNRKMDKLNGFIAVKNEKMGKLNGVAAANELFTIRIFFPRSYLKQEHGLRRS